MFVRAIFVLWLPSSLIAAPAASAAVANTAAKCYHDAPKNCTFRNEFCSWTEREWKRSSGYANLKYSTHTGSLTSRFSCVNSSVSHCLKFQYYLEKSKDCILKVFISDHNYSKTQLWKTSTKATSWKTAEIRVETNSSFQLIIEGTHEKRQRNQRVRIRDLTYDRHSCSSETTSTTTVSSTTTYSKPTTRASSSPVSRPRTPTATVPSSQSTGRPTLLPSSGDDTTRVHQGTDSTSSVETLSTTSITKITGGFRGDADSSTNTGVIVGVVLAVIIIVVCLVVVLLVIFRWKKRLLCWTMCSESKETAVQFSVDQGKDAFADVAATTTKDDTNYTELDVTDITPPNRYNCLGEARMSQVSMENYSVIKDLDKDQASFTKPGASMLYDLAKPVPLSTPNGLDNPGFRGALEDDYEIGDMDHIFQQPEDDYNHIRFDEKGKMAYEEPTYSNQTPYDHIQRINKPNTEAKPMLHITENDRAQQWLLDRTLEDKTLQESQTEASSVYHILEEKTPQNPQVKPPNAYQVAKNVENSTGQEPETQATSVYHILENGVTPQLKPGTKTTTEFHIVEDTTPPQADADNTSVYHILEAEAQTPKPPPQTTESYYLNLEEMLQGEKSSHDSRDVIHKSSRPAMLQSSPFPDEPETDYNRLHFDRKGMSSVGGKERENGGDEVYSHLKEGEEDTYDEVRRDRKRDVIDDDYYHI